MQGAVRVHNFDPVFAPDGSVVFASTRAGSITLKRLLPNADLYRVGPALDFTQVERMTWLLNSELSPAFMQNGVIAYFAAFKNHIGFYPPIKGDEKLKEAAARYAKEKGNLRFPLDRPIPYGLIRRIVTLKVRQNLAK